MFDFIEGMVVRCTPQGVVIAAGGIGYSMITTRYTQARCTPGKSQRVYVHLSVRDDGLTLFGFINEQERAMFLKLIAISGVGPKLGVAVLSSMEPGELAAAIALSDAKALVGIPGIGKKTAERIILELRESVADIQLGATQSDVSAPSIAGDAAQEAAQALLALGYTAQEAAKAVAAQKDADDVESILKGALRTIGSFN